MTNAIEYTKAVLDLFKRVPEVSGVVEKTNFDDTIDKGFVYSEKAISSNSVISDPAIIQFIADRYGRQLEKINQGFYKSFKTVMNKSIYEMYHDQILNYLSTYGLESIGIDSTGYAIVPASEFNLDKASGSENDTPLSILVIDVIDNSELIKRLDFLISTSVALDSNTIKSIMTVLDYVKDFYDDVSRRIDSLQNKELKIALYDYYNKVPSNPVDFLRFIVYKKTGQYLLIKSKDLLRRISDSTVSVEDYFRSANLVKLSEVFFRFKPIWLAFKSANETKLVRWSINRIRRLANDHHKPYTPKILDVVTSSANIDYSELRKELYNVSVYKRISLLNALTYRMHNPTNIAYYVRNGSIYVKDYKGSNKVDSNVFFLIYTSILDELRQRVSGKTIYIPSMIEYALPTSTKKFYDNIPFGTSVTLNKNIVLGVHWTNTIYKGTEKRTDLDLHLNSKNINIGWHSRFDSVNEQLRASRGIVFTGDMTNAPISEGGASEVYFIGEKIVDTMFMVNLNYYNLGHGTNSSAPAVKYELVIDNADMDRLNEEYLFNAYTLKFNIPSEISEHSKVIGILDIDSAGTKTFYFTSGTMSNNRISSYTDLSAKMIESTRHSLKHCVVLRPFLESAGAKVISEITDDTVVDINLDPVYMTKDIFLSMFEN